ncbi:hypothetical protein Sm713_59680 [Streptomyces sp. TS71-3]|nr:hypothetical protein Sm713_59680 [Streptomyces sp. TS71-3]
MDASGASAATTSTVSSRASAVAVRFGASDPASARSKAAATRSFAADPSAGAEPSAADAADADAVSADAFSADAVSVDVVSADVASVDAAEEDESSTGTPDCPRFRDRPPHESRSRLRMPMCTTLRVTCFPRSLVTHGQDGHVRLAPTRLDLGEGGGGLRDVRKRLFRFANL